LFNNFRNSTIKIYRNAKKVSLISPTSIAVSPSDGALFIAETDQKFVHRVRRVDPFRWNDMTLQ